MQALPFKVLDFDLIIASDILYERRMEDMLLDSLNNLVTEYTKVWIADPCRRGWNSFKENAAKSDLVPHTIHYQTSKNGGVNVEIIELTRTKKAT